MTELGCRAVDAGEGFGVAAEQLKAIAAAFGTPVYVLDLDRLQANLQRLSHGFSPDALLYSLKTNYLPEVVRTVEELGLGVDVVSGYELRTALRLGFEGARIVFNGPVKTQEELSLAIEAGAFVNIDAEDEIDVLASLARDRGQVIRVGLRVFPPDDVYRTSPEPKRRTIPSKFGWAIEGGDADRMTRAILERPELRLSGIHTHLGSQITNGAALCDAIRAVLDWIIGSGIGSLLDTLNLGGGFPVPGIRRYLGSAGGPSQLIAPTGGETNGPVADPIDIVRTVRALVADRGLSGARVYWEPGRAVVSDTMVLLCEVASVKRTSQGPWLILNGGLNLLPTAGPAESHRFQSLCDAPHDEPFCIAGPMCYEGDVFSLGACLPRESRRGDLVVIHDAGAYSISRATSFNRPRAAVVAVRGPDQRLCWRAESDEDIFAFSQSSPFAPTADRQ